MNAINRIRPVSQHETQYKKGRSHRSIKFWSIVVCITVTIYYFFNVFYLILFLNFRLFISFFSQTFPATQIKGSKVYFIFLISAFAIFSINNLNLCHRNFDVNRNHYNCKTFTTEILDTNRVRSKYIFRNSINHNLQRAQGNGDNIKFYWISFITSLFFYANNFTTQN